MTSGVEKQLELLSDKWSDALKIQDLNLALDIAFQGYAAARPHNNRAYRLMFLGFIKHAANRLFDDYSEHKPENQDVTNVCSFCLEQKTKLVRGVAVAICKECLDNAQSAI